MKQQSELKNVNKPLTHYLKELKNDDLKAICKFYGIKGYSSKKKDQLVEMINTFVLKDYEAAELMFNQISAETYGILNRLIINEENAVEGQHGDAVYFLFEQDEHTFIPGDVKAYLRKFVVEKSTSEDQDDEVIALVSAVNLYGYFSLAHYQQLLKKYLNMDVSVHELKNDLASVANIQNEHVLNPLLEDMEFDAPIDRSARSYYMPETWAAFKKYFNIEYYEQAKEIEQLLTYLKSYITAGVNPKDIEESLIVMMKTVDNPAKLTAIINEMVKEGTLQPLPEQPTELHLLAAYRAVRNWHLGGYMYNELKQQMPQQHVINKQVRKKSKKRRKNMNVSRLKK